MRRSFSGPRGVARPVWVRSAPRSVRQEPEQPGLRERCLGRPDVRLPAWLPFAAEPGQRWAQGLRSPGGTCRWLGSGRARPFRCLPRSRTLADAPRRPSSAGLEWPRRSTRIPLWRWTVPAGRASIHSPGGASSERRRSSGGVCAARPGPHALSWSDLARPRPDPAFPQKLARRSGRCWTDAEVQDRRRRRQRATRGEQAAASDGDPGWESRQRNRDGIADHGGLEQLLWLDVGPLGGQLQPKPIASRRQAPDG
jgi:hypothetical protein